MSCTGSTEGAGTCLCTLRSNSGYSQTLNLACTCIVETFPKQLDTTLATCNTPEIPQQNVSIATNCNFSVLSVTHEQTIILPIIFVGLTFLWLHSLLCVHGVYRLKECGEALLVEVSEVLFNELAFFRLMQTMGM